LSPAPSGEPALQLRQQSPDGPRPHGGEPWPDAARHDRRQPEAADRCQEGAAVAEILDRHLGCPSAEPADVADAFHDVDVPALKRDPYIEAAALRADREKVRSAGRWFVRNCGDRCSASVGLALLATDWVIEDGDVEFLWTIGLLSSRFTALAVECLNCPDAVLWRCWSTSWRADRPHGADALPPSGQVIAKCSTVPNGGPSRSSLASLPEVGRLTSSAVGLCRRAGAV
jgi:hypothetical protein